MLKTLTLSLTFAVALGMCSVSQAGPFHNHSEGCTTCGIASPQGPMVSPQAPYASPQGECGAPVAECGAKKKCSLFSGMGNKMGCCLTDLCKKMKPKPKMYTYEWVLKKKRVWCHKGNPCGAPACESCSGVYPSGQGYASPQASYGSPQAYGASQSYGSGHSYGSGQSYGSTGYSAPAYGGGSGQIAPAHSMSPAPAPVERGDEAPPAPEVPAAPSAPAAAPAPPAPSTPPTTSGLLFSTPSGN